MVSVATAPNRFAANVLVARLGSEGIVTELRGASDPYPLGEVEVLVEEAAFDTARMILLIDEVETALDEDGDDDTDLRAPYQLWMVVAVLVVTTIFSIARMFT